MQYEVEVNGRLRQVNVHRVDGRFVVSLDDQDRFVDAVRVDPFTLSLLIGDIRLPPDPAAGRPGDRGPAVGQTVSSHEVTLTTDSASGRTAVIVDGVPLTVTLNGRRRWGRQEDGPVGAGGPQRITAPMPGKVVRILTAVGELVTKRQPLVVVEAMKMENELRAPADGVVAELHVQEGQSVEAGTLLVVLGSA
jgi:biotin carboxyl carrier protein